MSIDILVDGPSKAHALTQLLPSYKEFGNVVVYINVRPSNSYPEPRDILCRAFEGNPNVSMIESSSLPDGTNVNYVVMAGKILQFFDDDLSSYGGIKSMLLEDVARDVFGGWAWTYFCTEQMPKH
jgi:hypothetical protein